MSFTQSQLEKLEAAYARGVLSVREANGNTVTYASLESMDKAIQKIRTELEVSSSSTTHRPRILRSQHTKGL